MSPITMRGETGPIYYLFGICVKPVERIRSWAGMGHL